MFIAIDDWCRWGPELTAWLEERFDADVLRRFNPNVEPNWLDWLDHQQAKMDGEYGNSVALFEEVIRNRYAGVKVIHATRLTNLDTVRECGLTAWSEQELIDQARDRYSGIAEGSHLERAIQQCNPGHRGGRVYSFASLLHALGMTHGYQLGRIPSFARQGGEFLAHVASTCRIEESAPPGRGYFLACNLPWAWLEIDQMTALAQDVLLTVITSRFFNPDDYNMLGSQGCIATRCDIPPRCIELIADVEALMNREDLTVGDIQWLPFQP